MLYRLVIFSHAEYASLVILSQNPLITSLSLSLKFNFYPLLLHIYGSHSEELRLNNFKIFLYFFLFSLFSFVSFSFPHSLSLPLSLSLSSSLSLFLSLSFSFSLFIYLFFSPLRIYGRFHPRFKNSCSFLLMRTGLLF